MEDATGRATLELGKVDGYGNGQRSCRAAFTLEIREGRNGLEVSMQGEIWNSKGTDIIMGGQCLDAPEFPNTARVRRIRELWQRWHLNGMNAGNAPQAEWLRANPITAVYPESYYEKALAELTEAGLSPDPVTGYVYGTAWCYEPVPVEVLDELRSLFGCDQ